MNERHKLKNFELGSRSSYRKVTMYFTINYQYGLWAKTWASIKYCSKNSTNIKRIHFLLKWCNLSVIKIYTFTLSYLIENRGFITTQWCRYIATKCILFSYPRQNGVSFLDSILKIKPLHRINKAKYLLFAFSRIRYLRAVYKPSALNQS